MHDQAGDDSTSDPNPDQGSDPSLEDGEQLTSLEADLDAVDAVLEAIDRGDLDAAESVAMALDPAGEGSSEPDPDSPDPDASQVTTQRDPG